MVYLVGFGFRVSCFGLKRRPFDPKNNPKPETRNPKPIASIRQNLCDCTYAGVVTGEQS